MPEHKKGETRSEWMKRCVPVVVKEGKTQDQAVGQCMGMWRSHMSKNCEHLVVNIQPDFIRDAKMNGEEYWVAPMVIMSECVANGSQGALLYPGEENAKWAPSWNHKPLVAPDHPDEGSACTNDFLDKHEIGVVLNTEDDGKTRAEGWFHKKKTTAKSPKVANALKQRRMIELSTGLYVDVDEKEGEHNGVKYKGIARNYRPDHLAILPDKVGAFSIRGGHGVLQLNEASFTEITGQLENALRLKYADQMKEMPSLYMYVMEVYSDYCIYCYGGAYYRIDYKSSGDTVTLSGDPSRVERDVNWVPVKNEEKKEEPAVEITNGEDDPVINRKFSTKARKKAAASGAALSDGSFPIQNADDLKNAIRAIGRAKDPAAAKRHIINRAKALGLTRLLPSSWKVNNSERRKKMTKSELIEGLIKNEETKWEDTDRKFLETLNEEQLAKMLPDEVEKPGLSFSSQEEMDAAVSKGVENAIASNAEEVKKKAEDALKKKESEKTPETKNTEQPKQMSVKEYLENMPPEFRTIHNNAMRSYQAEVERLVKVIANNKQNKFKPDDLVKMDIDMLRNLAAIAQGDAAENTQVVMPNFMGLTGPASVINASTTDEVLSLPVYNSKEFGAAAERK